jgi:ribosomal-protein-serine acetyltransferase
VPRADLNVCAIRLYEPADAEDLQAAVVESAAELGRWLGWAHAGYSREDARSWIETQRELNRQGLAHSFAIRGAAGGYLGGCGVNQLNAANRFANLGYWVRSSAMGRGVAPAAVRLVADHVFRETNLVRLEIVCAVGNVRSQRVAEKAGAVREGVLRSRLVIPGGISDAVMHSLIRNP